MSNQNNTKQLNSNLPPPLIPSKYKKQSHQYTKPYYLNSPIKKTSSNNLSSFNNLTDTTSISNSQTSNTNVKNLRIEIQEATYYNIPIGLPNTPSTYHSSNNPLSSVSADSEIKANENINTLDRPKLKLTYNSSSNTSSQKTPASNNTFSSDGSIKNKKQIYPSQINSSFPDTNVPILLSPINKRQTERNKSRKCTFNSYVTEQQSHLSETDYQMVNNMLNTNDINLMMQCTTNNDTNESNNSYNSDSNQNNGDKNDQYPKESNSNDNSGSESSDNFGSNSGSGSGDDGDKKKDNNNDEHMDENNSEKEQKQTEEEEEQDSNDEKTELKPVRFNEVNMDKPPKSVSTLSPIDECCMLSSSKSAPVPNRLISDVGKSILNKNAAEFVPDISLGSVEENCMLRDSKSVPVQRTLCKINEWVYGFDRVKRCTQLSKKFTKSVIPEGIRENIQNVYEFIEKCTRISLYHKNYFDYGQVRIFNYGFHDKVGNDLYCVADITDVNKYKMREELFRKNEIYDLLNGIAKHLPISTRQLSANMITNTIHKIQKQLCDAPMFCQKVIFNTKWHKVHMYNGSVNKKQFNTERMTLYFTKNKFIDAVTKFIESGSDNSKLLIPIVMFSGNKYQIEYLQIVPLRDDVTVGISYIYYNKTIKVTGIHLKKMNILNQHQLISNHKCNCLDSFISKIDDLHIGNPDDDKNRYKAARKEVCDLKTKLTEMDIIKLENEQLRRENKKLKQQENSIVNNLKNENEKLRNIIAQFQNNNSYSNSNSSSLPSMVPTVSSFNTSSGSFTLNTNLSMNMSKSNTPNMTNYVNVNTNTNTNGLPTWNHNASSNGWHMIQQPTPVENGVSMQNNYSNNYSKI